MQATVVPGQAEVTKLVVVTPATKPTVNITGLSMYDAEVLLEVIDRSIAGPPDGPRGAFDRLHRVLKSAGVRITRHVSFDTSTSGILRLAVRQ